MSKKKGKGMLDDIDMRKVAGGGLLIGAGFLLASELGLFGNGNDEGGAPLQQIREKAGRILGSQPRSGQPTVYQFAAQPAVTFPDAPTFDLSRLFAPTPIPTPVSAPSPMDVQIKEYYRTYKGHVAPREWEVKKILLSRGTIKDTPTGREYAPPAWTTTRGGAKVTPGLRPRIEDGAYISTVDLIARQRETTRRLNVPPPLTSFPAALGVSEALKVAGVKKEIVKK